MSLVRLNRISYLGAGHSPSQQPTPRRKRERPRIEGQRVTAKDGIVSATAAMFARSFFHGTKADLKPGDLIVVGYRSNFTDARTLSWVYFTGTLDAAIWGVELADGPGRERIYVVEPTGPVEGDPNLTDKRFPGNPTLSYRSRAPLRVIAEVTRWQGHTPERLQEMKDHLAQLSARGAEIID